MDKVSIYRQHLQELLTERARRGNPDDPVVSETIFDMVNDRYQLVTVGWKDNNTCLYGCVLHANIINGKIWIQQDGTEEALADRLVDRGVPKQDIVPITHRIYANIRSGRSINPSLRQNSAIRRKTAPRTDR